MHEPEHSFPSGHTEHDVAYYGFLLYLSFTPPVREWRYRWVLIPFQILAAFDILTIGYSRVLEGEHWLTDVLGGYLSGSLWLLLCIVIYRYITRSHRGAPAGERHISFGDDFNRDIEDIVSFQSLMQFPQQMRFPKKYAIL